MQTPSKQIIQTVLASSQFQTLLSLEISKKLSAVNSQFFNTLSVSQQPSNVMKISDMIAELSENLQQIISFNIKQALEQEYGLLIEDNNKMRNDIEDLKEQLLKMSIKSAGKNIIEVKACDVDSDFNDLEEILDNQSKIGSKETLKLKKELDSIKLMLLRFTNNSSTAILEEIDPDKKKKLEERIGKLGKDVTQMLQNSTEGTHLNDTISIETCIKQIHDVIERQKKFEANICEKYQTSLKSVWNVITMMEASFEEQRSVIQQNDSPIARK